MSVAHLNTSSVPLSVAADRLTIHELTVVHGEAASYVQSQLADHGLEATLDLLRRALPVGLVAMSMGTAGIDTGAMARTLEGFAERLDGKATSAMASLDQTLIRLQAGEATVARTATAVLETLPAQVERALAGQASSVRVSVAEATRAVQTAGMQQLTAVLDRHSDVMRNAISLDSEGPVRALRQDLLNELSSTRKELSEQLALVRSLVEATQVAKVAGAKSSRAVGAAFEDDAMAMCRDLVTAAGDAFEATGGQHGVGGTTRRTGDGVATLAPAITRHGPTVRLGFEAKHRSRPMSMKAHIAELEACCRNRDALGGLVLVPTRAEVPGGGAFARAGTAGYVVSAEDAETVAMVYLLLREQVVMLKLRQDDDSEIDLTQIEERLKTALEALQQFDEVGRLAVGASKALDRLVAIGKEAQAKVRTSLTEGLGLMHP